MTPVNLAQNHDRQFTEVTSAYKVAMSLPVSERRLPPTKKIIKDVLRQRGLKLALADEVLAVWPETVRVRENAKTARLIRRFGRLPRRHPIGGGRFDGWRQSPVIFSGTVQSRLEAVRIKAVLQTYLRHYATSHRWGSETVYLVTDPTQVGINQSLTWHKSGQWSGTSTHTVIWVPMNWRVRVPADLQVCGGMMTLDASPMDTPRDDVQVWHATWLVQGRGYAVRAVTGYIAAHDGKFYHANSMKAAISGVIRKANIIRQSPQDRHKTRVKALTKRVARQPDRIVTRQDAYNIGACQYGVESWCNLVGLGECEGATVREVLDGYIRHPAPEARLVILAATRGKTTDLASGC